MWFDDPVTERIGVHRAREVVATGADTVAVACPFCNIMLADLLATEDDRVQVRDVAEMLCERNCERAS
jgi:Fe-S oxidoreductase